MCPWRSAVHAGQTRSRRRGGRGHGSQQHTGRPGLTAAQRKRAAQCRGCTRGSRARRRCGDRNCAPHASRDEGVSRAHGGERRGGAAREHSTRSDLQARVDPRLGIGTLQVDHQALQHALAPDRDTGMTLPTQLGGDLAWAAQRPVTPRNSTPRLPELQDRPSCGGLSSTWSTALTHL